MLCDSQQWPSAASILQRSSSLLISMPVKSQVRPQEVSWEDDNTHTHTTDHNPYSTYTCMHFQCFTWAHGCHLTLKTNAGAQNWISDQRRARRRTARRQRVQRVQHTEAVSPTLQRTAPVERAQSWRAHGARAPLPADRKDLSDFTPGLLAKAQCCALQ